MRSPDFSTRPSLLTLIKLICLVVLVINIAPIVPVYAQGGDPCDNPANPIVAENCLPGTDEWIVDNPYNAVRDIEGYAYPVSVNKGETVELFVNTTAARFDIQIYRSGYYGGLGGRLIQTATDVPGQSQPACHYDCQTGLTSCANWSASYRLTVPEEWVSGVYIAKLIRRDTGGESYALFTVRDDERDAPLLFQNSLFTYHAYNNYGGKSLYTSGSGECNTISGAPRAVKVSLHRPYGPGMGLYSNFGNNYFRVEYAMARWLEQQGYDLSYTTDLDTHRSGLPETPNELLDHQAFLIAGHDEYWTQAMRDAVTEARDAGVHIGNFSSNTTYWRVRLEPDPWTGDPDSVIVCYKTAEAGIPDPSGHPTSTYRDPAGPDDPENSLLGIQYIGDNDGLYFSMRITAEHGQDRIYRHTDLQTLPPGTYRNIGGQIIGWEWDAVIDNGRTPEGLEVLAESPVFGFLLLDPGNFEVGDSGAATAYVTRYTAPSGAMVLSIGAMQWSWGLGAQRIELTAPDPYVEQITYNILADMGIQPASPAEALILDGEEGMLTSDPETIYALDAPNDLAIENLQIDQPTGSIINDGRTVTISWDTNIPTKGQVWFGDAPEHIIWGRAQIREFTPEHEAQIINLIPGHVYYYRIVAVDERGLMTTVEGSFQTPTNLFVTVGMTILDAIRALRCWAQCNPALAVALGLVIVAVVAIAVWRVVRYVRGRIRPTAST